MTGTASMIASLSGVVAEVADDGGELVLEVGGVGYRVLVTPLALRELDLPPAGPSPGDELRLHIHHVVREDAQVLYGFATSDQRRVFGELIGAHGVGPALALAILSVHTPDELRGVVASGDAASLRGVPGVGAKTAARLLVDLATRLGEPTTPPRVVGDGGARSADVRSEVRDALEELGYRQEEIRTVLSDLPEEGDTSDLLRTALQRLAVA